MIHRHRRLIVLRGQPAETAKEAALLIERIPSDDLLWITAREENHATKPSHIQRLLGRSFDVVVLDLHFGLSLDLIGQAHGFIWGGGAMILRLPPTSERPPKDPRLHVFPYDLEQVGERTLSRFEDRLLVHKISAPSPLSPATHCVEGTQDQALAVRTMTDLLSSPTPQAIVLTANRGRGKSSALGLALKALALEPLPQTKPPLLIWICAAHSDATLEIFHFAKGSRTPLFEGYTRFVSPGDLLQAEKSPDLIVVDEAAQLPVPFLKALTHRHPSAHLVFSTTIHGYEGTGRGFSLRFVRWLKDQTRPLTSLSLEAPIRWASGDPLEEFVFDTLLLDAAPPESPNLSQAPIQHQRLDRDQLVASPRLLRAFFGLLVHAHYRTTPRDLERILDAPNLDLHALLVGDEVVSVTMVAKEGGLYKEQVDGLLEGHLHLHGHALVDSMVAHMGAREAGALTMIRSVRIATHPDLRRRGLARRLIEEIHATYQPDLFGTLFGLSLDLLRFRRKVGYELVRLSASRGARTGEPSALMLKPISEAAKSLFSLLRQDLAQNLPLQLALLEAGELSLEPGLIEEACQGLPEASPLRPAAVRHHLLGYANGPRTLESVIFAARQSLNEWDLGLLSPKDQALVQARIQDLCSWPEVLKRSGYSNVRLAMRALKRSIRRLLEDSGKRCARAERAVSQSAKTSGEP